MLKNKRNFKPQNITFTLILRILQPIFLCLIKFGWEMTEEWIVEQVYV